MARNNQDLLEAMEKKDPQNLQQIQDIPVNHLG